MQLVLESEYQLNTELIPGLIAGSSEDSGSNTDNAAEQKSSDYLQVSFDGLSGELSNGIDSAESKYLNQMGNWFSSSFMKSMI